MFLPHGDIFRDFYTIHLYLVTASAEHLEGCYIWYVFVKMYIRWIGFWGTFSLNHEGCERDPITLCIVYVKLIVHDIYVHVYTTNILYIFT